MENSHITKKEKANRLFLFMIFLICGLTIFFVSVTFSSAIPGGIRIWVRIGISLLFLAIAFYLRINKRFEKYWKVLYAFFVASFSFFMGGYLSGLALRYFNLTVDTHNGIAFAKMFESLFTVIFIILLIKISGDDLGTIFLKKGKLKSGLAIGLAGFLGFAIISIAQAGSQGISISRIISWLPLILIFVLSNGFMEELLFRGLFLKRYERFVGARLANLLTALIFTLAHMKVSYAPELLIFLVIVFFLALFWGYIMQKTENLWGSALFHAGADLLLIIGIFAKGQML